VSKVVEDSSGENRNVRHAMSRVTLREVNLVIESDFMSDAHN
jgi:hypothetical protein